MTQKSVPDSHPNLHTIASTMLSQGLVARIYVNIPSFSDWSVVVLTCPGNTPHSGQMSTYAQATRVR